MDLKTPEIESVDLSLLNQRIIDCSRCKRLRDYCESVAKNKRRAFADQTYWGLPVPNFGDPFADRLIVGLAPAAHGANRTGRMFTGDRSGDFLFEALHSLGAANMPRATSAEDGLKLKGVYITSSVHCAPPDNKPTRQEILNCQPHLHQLLESRNWKSMLCLGGLAWHEVAKYLKQRHQFTHIPKFAHGAAYNWEQVKIIGSYHPSQQNTFTGRLTMPMFVSVLSELLKD